jgi:hypothetical protein
MIGRRFAPPREVTMTGRTDLAVAAAPDWIVAEMPPGYETRLLEIKRLSAELQAMSGIGRVLWETGEALKGAVGTLFAALKCEVDPTPSDTGAIVVGLGGTRRLLLVVSGAGSPIQKTNEELTRSFQAVQFAGANDRVVLLVNNNPALPPADRPDPVLPDALGVLQRMGVDVLTTVTLFRMWRLSIEDQQKARKALDRLHAQDGGQFLLPARSSNPVADAGLPLLTPTLTSAR